ncbi:MAG: YceH family protein [Rhodothermales bacterium]|nr:YceH family protein [Rhodothermales bacterium]
MEPLSAEAVRVLGVLIEKELSTPDYYPLTLNSLTNGCNQKSNRDPVVSYEESEVLDALDELTRRRLVGRASVAGSRAIKYRHAIAEQMQLDQKQRAALATLLLRGPQTIGEVRSHTGRMAEFADLDDTADTLRSLRDMDPPMVVQLPVQPGKKEARIAHLMAGDIDVDALEAESAAAAVTAAPQSSIRQELDELRERVDALEEELRRFTSQFE